MYLISAPRSRRSAPDPIPEVVGARFRVILIALPDLEAEPPWEGSSPLWELDPHSLPVVVFMTDDRRRAEEVAGPLREAGASVVVVSGWDGRGFCGAHGAEYAHASCGVCDAAICRRCQLESAGRPLCPEHQHARARRSRRLRVRQLFAIFLFAVFLFKIGDRVLADRMVALEPPVEVGVFQFVPPGLAQHPLVRGMNQTQTEGRRPRGLLAIKEWYDAEYRRYTGSNREYLTLKLQGPWFTDVAPPPLATPDDGPLALMWRSLNYSRYWRTLARSRGVDPDDFGARLYVIYERSGDDVASHSRGSEKGRVAVVHIALDEENPTYAAITLAHELGHVLGATDKYEPDTFHSAYPEGYVEPYVRPLYPQRYAELMAVDRPLNHDVEAEVRVFDRVRVGHRTAAEMHWISEAQADYFYQQEGADPLDRLAADIDVE